MAQAMGSPTDEVVVACAEATWRSDAAARQPLACDEILASGAAREVKVQFGLNGVRLTPAKGQGRDVMMLPSMRIVPSDRMLQIIPAACGAPGAALTLCASSTAARKELQDALEALQGLVAQSLHILAPPGVEPLRTSPLPHGRKSGRATAQVCLDRWEDPKHMVSEDFLLGGYVLAACLDPAAGPPELVLNWAELWVNSDLAVHIHLYASHLQGAPQLRRRMWTRNLKGRGLVTVAQGQRHSAGDLHVTFRTSEERELWEDAAFGGALDELRRAIQAKAPRVLRGLQVAAAAQAPRLPCRLRRLKPAQTQAESFSDPWQTTDLDHDPKWMDGVARAAREDASTTCTGARGHYNNRVYVTTEALSREY